MDPEFFVGDDGFDRLQLFIDGRPTEEVVRQFKGGGGRVLDQARQVLAHSLIEPTLPGIYQFVIPRLENLVEANCNYARLLVMAQAQDWRLPTAYFAPAIRLVLSDGLIRSANFLALMVMHPPLRDGQGSLRQLGIEAGGTGQYLFAYFTNPGANWSRARLGFVFLESFNPSG